MTHNNNNYTAQYLQTLAENLTKQHKTISEEVNKLNNKAINIFNQCTHINSILIQVTQEPTLKIDIKDYLTEEQYQDYLDSYNEPEMLCEFDITFTDWLDWFYEELPFLQSNKHLVFSNHKDITTVPMNSIIKVDHNNKTIYLDTGSEIITVNLNGIELYYLLNVKYQRDWEDYTVSNYEY